MQKSCTYYIFIYKRYCSLETKVLFEYRTTSERSIFVSDLWPVHNTLPAGLNVEVDFLNGVLIQWTWTWTHALCTGTAILSPVTVHMYRYMEFISNDLHARAEDTGRRACPGVGARMKHFPCACNKEGRLVSYCHYSLYVTTVYYCCWCCCLDIYTYNNNNCIIQCQHNIHLAAAVPPRSRARDRCTEISAAKVSHIAALRRQLRRADLCHCRTTSCGTTVYDCCCCLDIHTRTIQCQQHNIHPAAAAAVSPTTPSTRSMHG